MSVGREGTAARRLQISGQGITQAPTPKHLPYRWRNDPAADAAARVCRWRRSLLAALIILEDCIEAMPDEHR